MSYGSDTVAAVSTPRGKGGIAVIRISGPDAVPIAEKVFIPRHGDTLSQHKPRQMVYGDIFADGSPTDDGMAVIFRAPESYTGEDTVEISCHGGILLTQAVLEAVLLAGARPAEAGEFTRRAYMNGRLGLIKAESVIDLIDADTREGLRLAAAQSRGVLSAKINAVYDEMKRLCSSVYAYIDFPDEDLTDVTPEELSDGLHKIKDDLDRLVRSYKTGRAVRDGIPTAIVGKPNVGKSSLLNAMLGEERAIVTDIAGTTRDVITEKVQVGGCTLLLSDTAGIRSTDDQVEQIGVARALKEAEKAELIIAVFDGSRPADEDDISLINELKKIKEQYPEKTVIAAINKNDLGSAFDLDSLKDITPHSAHICAAKGDISGLISIIDACCTDGTVDISSDAVISSARQYAAVKRAADSIDSAVTALESGFTQDMAGLEIEHAMSEIAEVDGLSVSEDIVADIFGRFCVGK